MYILYNKSGGGGGGGGGTLYIIRCRSAALISSTVLEVVYDLYGILDSCYCFIFRSITFFFGLSIQLLIIDLNLDIVVCLLVPSQVDRFLLVT
jgi:hypothetical protein